MATIQFQDMGTATRPFLAISQNTVDLLERITSAEKAQAVPYMKMWRIKPESGEPVHGKDGVPTGPLSTTLVLPPSFGVGADIRFRERPPVSFGKATIKTHSPKGIILFRQINLTFTVHRPEIIFQEPEVGRDNWSDLLIPGCVFAMEYGWTASSGVKNGLLNGEGFVDTGQNPHVVVPARTRIRFVVTHYDFKVQSDSQIVVTVDGIEDGELSIRQAFLGGPQPGSKDGKIEILGAVDPYSAVGQEMLTKLSNDVKKMFGSADVKKGSKGYDDVVPFKTVCDVLFAPLISACYTTLGYNQPELWLGKFNERAGKLVKYYGGGIMSGKSIGDFTIPKRLVAEIFAKAKGKKQITLQNFLQIFLAKIMDADIWTRTKGADEIGCTLQTRVITNKKSVSFYVIDMNRELTRFVSTDRDSFRSQIAGSRPTRAEVRDALKKKGVPMITFGHGNSYIQEADFSVMNDDPIKTLLMIRGLKEASRIDMVEKTELKRKLEEQRPQLLYSSAIRGEINMMGNFAFDTFGLVWLDFEVPVWSGPFFVTAKTDTIDRSGFFSAFSVYSSGEDPLGTRVPKT